MLISTLCVSGASLSTPAALPRRQVAWHPRDDTRLAFGTEEGRVGVCHAAGTKPAVVCADHHRGAVYCVAWGPDGALYSLSPGEVWRHEPTHLSASQWSAAAGHSACSQLAFGAGGVALGRQVKGEQALRNESSCKLTWWHL